jgi:hypothetical protein
LFSTSSQHDKKELFDRLDSGNAEAARRPDLEPWDLWDMPGYRPRKKKRTRRLSTAALIKQAEQLGKTVSSITTLDGTTLTFGDPEPTETTKNPWLADLNKVKQQ